MVPKSLVAVASFSPNSIKSPTGWVGHLPFATWVIQEVSPKLFVELGTHSGNSYFSFCQSVAESGIATKCYAVDTWQGDEHAGQYNDEVFAEVRMHNQAQYAKFSRLLRMTFDEAVNCFEDESIELLHIDGMHTYRAVRHDFETWLPKLAPGAVIIFHDTNVRERNFGVYKLWGELQARYPNNLEFMHSHGLGVLQLNNAPKDRQLQWLQSDFPEKTQLIDYFAALGAWQLERYEFNELKLKWHYAVNNNSERCGHIWDLTYQLDDALSELDDIYASKKWRLVMQISSVISWVKARLSNFRSWKKSQIRSWKRKVLCSQLDVKWYLDQYPDVAASGMDPYEHYMQFGKAEGRKGNAEDCQCASKFCMAQQTKSWKQLWKAFLLSKRRAGSISNMIKKLLKVLTEHGINGVVIKCKKCIYDANNSNQNAVKYFETKHDDASFHSSASILFVGHDAHLAGAQVLLLSLIKWFSEYTGIEIKVILLHKGHLLDKYQQVASVLIWEDLLHNFPAKEMRREKLLEFIDKADLIYGNTMLAPTIYDELEFLHVPFITHVHELEKSIQMYVDKATIEKMRLFTQGFIAGSNPVSLNLIYNHLIDEKNIITVNDFIEKRDLNFDISKKDLRKKMGLAENGVIVFGCGTMYWRKGVDLFIETALLLKQKGYLNFHFYWIGANIWDLDNASRGIYLWSELEYKILNNGLKNHITFLGIKENLSDYFLAGDIFYLSSREDPFPLVCLEAAQCSVPIICFAEAGGTPDFVENDAGFVVPYEDINAAAEKIITLANNCELLNELGATARKKFLLRHSVDVAAPDILNFCRRIGSLSPAVSIIVPNYNCERFLTKRLDSIINQTFKDFELIILDDASTDQSLKIIEKYLHLPFVKLIKNQTNSGSPFIQWHKGFLQARGEIIWFAEADDFCAPDFLQKLLPNFNYADVALAYSDSLIVDGADSVTGNYEVYLEQLHLQHWKSSYQVTDSQEINFGLGVKNSIPNASAVLVRKSCVSEDVFKGTFQFKFSGDWFFYTQVIKGNSIAFCAEKLNYHRKHNVTVTSKFTSDKSAFQLLVNEQEKIHEIILNTFTIDSDFLHKWDVHVASQIHTFYPDISKDDFDKFYPYTLTKEKIKQAIIKGEQTKRLVFITTNDGAPNGGSEQLWIEAALEFRKRGYEVMVVIKNWNPAPQFIQLFYNAGIRINFKGRNDFNRVLLFKPDLLIFSIGDQDEGIEWYQQCKEHNVAYVIINQLTKEPEYWPVKKDINQQVKYGYLNAVRVFFTCNNNRAVMEKRLNCKIPNADIHYNPFHVDRNTLIPFPPMDHGLKIAIPANLSRVHKGQHLAIELFSLKKWRERPIQLNLYGEGYDEEILQAMVKKYRLEKVFFHQHTRDLLTIWHDNHAILMPSFMEGLPIVLVGAMICARVPILTDVGAHKELIDDNANGFIAKKPTVEALDEALERAYQKSEMWEEIGKRAREKILSILPDDPVNDFITKIIPFITN